MIGWEGFRAYHVWNVEEEGTEVGDASPACPESEGGMWEVLHLEADVVPVAVTLSSILVEVPSQSVVK